MPKRLLSAVLVMACCLMCVLDLAPAAAQQEADLDCEDFATQEEAQAVFDADPADPNNLDPNGDGIACALLPSGADDVPADEGDGNAQQPSDDAQAQSREERRQNRQNRQNQPAEETAAVTCDQFATQEEAQAAFDADPAGLVTLDEDGNGIACEELQAAAPQEETRAERRRNRQNRNADEAPADNPPAQEQPVAEDLDCIDFDFQEEAQAIFDQDPNDPFNLDPNGDGFACSSLPLSNPVVTQVPRTGVASAPNSAWWLVVGTIAAGAVATAASVAARRQR